MGYGDGSRRLKWVMVDDDWDVMRADGTGGG